MSLYDVDANGRVVLNLPDLIEGNMLTEAQIQRGLGSKLKLHKGEMVNPFHWKVHVWDKKGSAKISVEAEVKVEE